MLREFVLFSSGTLHQALEIPPVLINHSSAAHFPNQPLLFEGSPSFTPIRYVLETLHHNGRSGTAHGFNLRWFLRPAKNNFQTISTIVWFTYLVICWNSLKVQLCCSLRLFEPSHYHLLQCRDCDPKSQHTFRIHVRFLTRNDIAFQQIKLKCCYFASVAFRAFQV